jgi:hypothetical protein
MVHPNQRLEGAPPEHLQGSVERVTFHSPESGFCVLRVKVRGQRELATGPEGLPEQLGPVDFPLGIITGNQHSFFDAWLSDVIPGTDDGKVSVERAKVEGMADFLVLPYSHPFIMNAEEVIEQTLQFLRGGRFGARPPSAEGSSD